LEIQGRDGNVGLRKPTQSRERKPHRRGNVTTAVRETLDALAIARALGRKRFANRLIFFFLCVGIVVNRVTSAYMRTKEISTNHKEYILMVSVHTHIHVPSGTSDKIGTIHTHIHTLRYKLTYIVKEI
jgi:hypothetical protein